MHDGQTPKRLVVAAALVRRRADDLILMTRRPSGKHLAQFWEFPGGKVEAGEAPDETVRRELREELNIDVEVGDVFAVGHHVYPSREVILIVYDTCLVSGQPASMESQEFEWMSTQKILKLELPPADKPVTDRLAREQI